VDLVLLDLPSPAQLRGPWAALAAVLAARGWGADCFSADSVWHYDDGGGNWADLHHLDDANGDHRAVLVGHDHEYSDTYFRAAATYFQEEETDLLAGAPTWWEPPVEAAEKAGNWVGFVYGYDGRRWQRAAYDLSDGFESLNLPALSVEVTRERIDSLTDGTAPPAAIDALIAAGADATPDQVAAVVGHLGWDTTAATTAAHTFRP
jgi:hypothetical protein